MLREWRPDILDLHSDGYYPDLTGLRWYPSEHQNHVCIISCWNADAVRLRGLNIDLVDFAFRRVRAFHCIYNAVHNGAYLEDYVAVCTTQA